MLYLRYAFRFALGSRDFGDDAGKRVGDITPLQALTTSLASTIGNGNIAGVCTAISMGGPGAVFWMWVSAVFGMATKLVEAVLGQQFRVKGSDGLMAGGPMYYLETGLKMPRLAAVFAFFMGCKVLISTSLVQSNSIAVALESQMGLDHVYSGVGLSVLTWLVIIGGIKSIGRVTLLVSPFMAILYIVGAGLTLLTYYDQIPHAFELILRGAFQPSSVEGGATGIAVTHAVRYGLARGAYSNEAGTGTAGVFHAAARTGEPVRQGLIACLDVFIDTLVICTLTALAVLTTGAWTGSTSTAMTVGAFNLALPVVGGMIVALSSFLFGLSSLFTAPYYGETALAYLLGPNIRRLFRWSFCSLIVLGPVLQVEAAWSISDVLNGLMTLTNLIGVICLSGFAVSAVTAYLSRLSNQEK